MESTILDSISGEIISVMTPFSICMLLVVLLVYTTLSPSAAPSDPIRTAANLVYLERPKDSATQKLEGAFLNAIVFVFFIVLVTFLLFLLYYYNFNNFLKNYMRFSAFFVLGTMGGSIFLSIIQKFSIPVDSITCFVLLFNFTIVGVLSVFSGGIPTVLRQGYTVCLGIVVATWFTKLPEWTTRALLMALAIYDLVAVLAPGGPLKLLVELASSRDEELPALVYEARPMVSQNDRSQRSGLGFLVGGGVSDSGSVELQVVSRNAADGRENQGNPEFPAVNVGNFENIEQARSIEQIERLPLVGHSREEFLLSGLSSTYSTVVGGNRENEIVVEEASPLVDMRLLVNNNRENARDSLENSLIMERSIRLGLGDFIFYSVPWVEQQCTI